MERRLAAILFADVAGFSRLVGLDEDRTLAALRERRRDLVDPAIFEHGGRIVKSMGDGLLAEFASAQQALRCACAIQRAMIDTPMAGLGETMRFRIGIHLSDVVVENGDIHGEGVNIAARLQGLAAPGGICLSGAVRDALSAVGDLTFDDLGEPSLHNILRPVHVYALAPTGGAPREASATMPVRARPAIAVLPFDNLSGDPAQDYFADGLVEEILTALARVRWLFVVARNSSFVYKGRAVDVKQVGRELGVRYVLEGSVRRAGGRLRIHAQLIDAETANHLWADRIEGEASDIFALQDRVMENVVGAIEPNLRLAEIERARRKPTSSLDAYDLYLRALHFRHAMTAAGNEQALALLRQAIVLDPHFASALAHAAMCCSARRDQGWAVDEAPMEEEGVRLARAAVDADPDDPVALCLAGHTIAALSADAHGGLSLIERSLAINPNAAETWARGAMARIYVGDLESAIVHAQRALRLSPRDPMLFLSHGALAYAHLFARRFDEARRWAIAAVDSPQRPAMGYRVLAVAEALSGDEGAARQAAAMILDRDPGFRVDRWAARSPFRRAEQHAMLIEGFIKAGLPR